MTIKFKIAFYYTILTIIVLSVFAFLGYLFLEKSRRNEFFDRMESRAVFVAGVIMDGNEIKVPLFKLLDKKKNKELPNEKIYLFDQMHNLVYASDSVGPLPKPDNMFFTDLDRNEVLKSSDGNRDFLAVKYVEDKIPVYVWINSFDRFGQSNMDNLKRILLMELGICLVLIPIIGYVFARRIMAPINTLVAEVDNITMNNINDAGVEVKGNNEITRLSNNFNTMLERLSKSFDLQKSFVNNASHELRTPLASIIGQLQVSLAKNRSNEAYQMVMESILEDANGLSELTNGLLQLAQSEVNNNKNITHVHLEELLTEIPATLKNTRQNAPLVQINFVDFPDGDDDLVVTGNESLLKILFSNLVENAGKYSDNNQVKINIGFDLKNVFVSVINSGKTIPENEIDKIFDPFFRSESTANSKGFGLGLSICKKVIDLHKGKIECISKNNQTEFKVYVPKV